MNWRTNKPKAAVIVAKFNNIYEILNRDEQGNYFLQDGFVKKAVLTSDIEKWADLEEDETVTDCNELEKEIDDWYNTMGIPVTTDALKETARYFAKWGAEHRTIINEITK